MLKLNKSLYILSVLFILIFAFLSFLALQKNKFKSNSQIVIDSNLAQSTVELAKENLLNRRINPTGLFIYDFDLKTGKMPSKDHEVRQMDALFALSELNYYGYLSESEQNLLKDSIAKVLKNSQSFACAENTCRILSYHDSTLTGSIYLLYKAMLLLAMNENEWSSKNKDAMQELFNSILYSQKDNGDFTSFLHSKIDRGTINSTDGMGFAMGEALSALALHLQMYPEDLHAKASINKALDFLKARGLDKQYNGMYLWFMRAADYIAQNDKLDQNFKEDFANSARIYHDSVLDKLYLTHPKYNTCPHTEGLAHFILLSQQMNWPYSAELSLYNKALAHNYKLQIKEENIDNILTKLNFDYNLLQHKYAKGAFLSAWKSDAGVRVDFLAHCIGAYLPYNDIINK